MSLSDRRKTAPALRASLSTNNLSSATIKRRLCEAGLNGCVARHKPLLTATHKKRRLDFAREHISWSSEMWSKVLWSDESRFCLYQNDGRVYVRRRIGEDYLDACVVPTVKHGGGGIMVWGCMMTKGVGHLALVSGNLNSCGYIDLLENAMIPSTHGLSVSNDYVFQQDNARCHTSRQTMSWFLENNVNVMAWPAQSRDMNPIENLWDELGRRLDQHTPRNKDQLWEIVKDEWYQISTEVTKKLVESMQRRLQAVIDAKGGHTRYWTHFSSLSIHFSSLCTHCCGE